MEEKRENLAIKDVNINGKYLRDLYKCTRLWVSSTFYY
jgi:hypothetical protein